MKNYNAIIIGSGQGGTPLSYSLADLGWRVALIERAQLGGSCINYGCTPTKTMIASSRIAHYAKIGPKFGVHPGKIQVNMAEVIARKNEIVESFRDGPVARTSTFIEGMAASRLLTRSKSTEKCWRATKSLSTLAHGPVTFPSPVWTKLSS